MSNRIKLLNHKRYNVDLGALLLTSGNSIFMTAEGKSYDKGRQIEIEST